MSLAENPKILICDKLELVSKYSLSCIQNLGVFHGLYKKSAQ